MSASQTQTDTIIINASEDYYLGDAQFQVSIDGVAFGAPQTVTALHASGQSQNIMLSTSLSAGAHQISIAFINDAYAGTPSTDRNLYVNAITLDSATDVLNATLLSNGSTTTAGLIAGVGADTLTVNVSEDFYLGNAQFQIFVDGKAVGAVQTATALRAAGASQNVSVTGNFGAGSHTVAVQFLNDAYGGTASTDRNLYVNAVTLNGNTVQVGATLLSTGSTSSTSIGSQPAVTIATAKSSVLSSTQSTQSPSTATLSLLGVNLSGAEYNPGGGVMGYAYTYPTNAEIDYYASKGLNVIRMPVSLERLEPTPGGALDPVQMAQIESFVKYAASKGMTVDIDAHNYGYAWGNLVGASAQSTAQFANFWSDMATALKSDSNVMFGLMNEPHDQTPTQWFGAAQAAINAIRATGAGQEILVSGTYWDGVQTWVDSGNAAIAATIVDPMRNMAFEGHLYFDGDNSGTSTAVVDPNIGPERLAGMTAWAQATGNRVFVGELGAASDPASLTALSNTLTYLDQHSNVWQGATEWAGGPWLGSYMFSVEPTNGVDKPQLALLSANAPGNSLG